MKEERRMNSFFSWLGRAVDMAADVGEIVRVTWGRVGGVP